MTCLLNGCDVPTRHSHGTDTDTWIEDWPRPGSLDALLLKAFKAGGRENTTFSQWRRTLSAG